MALRGAGLSNLVGVDLGDASTAIDSAERDQASGVRALPATVQAAHSLADFLSEAMAKHTGSRPLVVGGDCSILLGILPALRKQFGQVGLWFLDGHPDYLDGHSSETGETADMDLAILTGEGVADLVHLAGSPPMVIPEDVVLLGHRTHDLDEASALELARLPADLRRIDSGTIGSDPNAAGSLAASWLAPSSRPVWLHVDLDVLDPTSLPAVTYPQSGGLDWDSLGRVLEPLVASPLLSGVSIADFRPDLDTTGLLGKRIARLLELTLS